MIFDSSKESTAILYLKGLFAKGKRIKIEPVAEKRSHNQNNLLWLWYACISRETGNSSDLLHELFKEMFLPLSKKEVFGIEKKILTSTTELNTIEFKNYLDKIQIFAASELGITLPNPEDLHFAEFQSFYKNYL